MKYTNTELTKQKTGGVVVALCAPNPQVPGSVLELSKEDSPFHTFSGSVN